MDVDLVICSSERSYRYVLRSGFFERIARQNHFRFARRVALINGVNDEAQAVFLAKARRRSGEIDDFHLVRDQAPLALARTGLRYEELGSTDLSALPSLVAISLAGSEWVVRWDSDVSLTHNADWIEPAIGLMEFDPRVLVANPGWRHDNSRLRPRERAGSWDLGHGFSDHVYLARRRDLARPISADGLASTRRFAPGRWSHIFESRLGAHLHHYGRLCATHRTISYKLDDSLAEESYSELEHPEEIATPFAVH